MTAAADLTRPIDKTDWPEGPWHAEPDRVEWTSQDIVCLALRADVTGAWCGYIGVRPGHPWHGRDYDAIECSVHGGLTYAHAAHAPQIDSARDVSLWFIGFDCAHWRDRMPGMEAFYSKIGMNTAEAIRGTYRDLAYVMTETENLAQQARAARVTS